MYVIAVSVSIGFTFTRLAVFSNKGTEGDQCFLGGGGERLWTLIVWRLQATRIAFVREAFQSWRILDRILPSSPLPMSVLLGHFLPLQDALSPAALYILFPVWTNLPQGSHPAAQVPCPLCATKCPGQVRLPLPCAADLRCLHRCLESFLSVLPQTLMGNKEASHSIKKEVP